MKNFFKLLGIIALVAVIGFSMAACKNDDEGGGTDPALNGTWVQTITSGSYTYTTEIKLNNGNIEESRGQNGMSLSPIYKGTYTTSGNSISVQMTHYYHRANWLTKDQLKSAQGTGMSDTDIDLIFKSVTAIWSVSGNTLTLAGLTYTRKS